MRIWLDDIRDPVDPFIQEHFGATVNDVWIKDATETIALLAKNKVDFISFDHDLGTDLTGYDVAKFIESGAYFNQISRLKWRVHSSNAVGSARIVKAMEQADKYWDEHEQN